MIDLILMCIGGATIGAVVGTLGYFLCREIARVHRVAKDYDRVLTEANYWADRNHFRVIAEQVGEDRNRLHRAERRVDGLEYRSLEHMDTFRHTKRTERKKRVKK